MNLTEILREALVGKVIQPSTIAPVRCEPFHVEDIRIDGDGALIIFPAGGSPIRYDNPADFHFTDETPKTKSRTRTVAAITVTEPEPGPQEEKK